MDNESHSASKKFLDSVQTFLAGRGNPNHQDQFKDTLLHFAAKVTSRSGIVEELLYAGADANSVNFLRQTPLQIAVLHRNLIGVIVLIKFGARVNSQDCRGNSILHSAINACASMDKNWNCENPYCPHRAPDMRIISKLLESDGINVNIQNFQGYTPLLVSVKNKNLDIVKALLKRHAFVYIGNYSNETPLHAALTYPRQNIEIAGELLRRGASLTYLDINGHSPLDRVFKREGDAELQAFAVELVKLVTLYDQTNELFKSLPRMNAELQELHRKCFEEVNEMQREGIGKKSVYDLVLDRMTDTSSAPHENIDILTMLSNGGYTIYSAAILKYIYHINDY